jgi:hypothetical protein
VGDAGAAALFRARVGAVRRGRGEGGSWRRFAFIAAGLNLIWLTAPQDVLYFFVWLGLYDARYPYFDYLPPQGMWNLWNMLLLRVPIGVGAGSLLVWAGRDHSPVTGNAPGHCVPLKADRRAGSPANAADRAGG